MRPDDSGELDAKLNAETARLRWADLERHFAAGNLIAVGSALDLIEVASRCAQDDAAQIGAWMQAGQLGPVSDVQAQRWQAANAELWAVVVKPWVLVQEG